MGQNNFILNLIARLKVSKNDIDMSVKQATKQAQNTANKSKIKLNVEANDTGIRSVNNQMKLLANNTQTTNSVFGKLKNSIVNTFSGARVAFTSFLFVLNEINKACQNAKNTILDMDKAVTDLSVAMNGTREEAAEYVKVLNKQAIELKTTTKSVTNASDTWLRQNKSIAETETLIRDSLILSKVGKIESADASNYLTSALNGYKLEAEDAITVIDKLTAVDAASASEAGGLALSMSKTASAADMAGVSMDKLIGWLSVVKSTTRDSDEAVGNMAKTMLSRMNQVKAGKFIDEETGESLNDMEKVLKKVGVSMRDMNGQFISSEVVLDELGKKFNEFDSVTQRAIATSLGGTYQYEKVIALLSNYGDVLKYAEISANSAGSAMQKFNESYLGSLEASQAKLQATFESMIINSNFDEVYSDIIKATTALVEFINKTNALRGISMGLTVGIGVKSFLALKTGITQAYIALNQYQQALTIANKTQISTNEFTRLLMLTKNLSTSQTRLVITSKNLTLIQKKQILMNQGLSESEAKLHLQNLGLATSYTGLRAATVSVTNACKGLFNTIKANPLMWITTLISGVTMAWESYKQNVEEANERAKTAATSASTLVDEIAELTSKYHKLSKAVETDETAKEELLSTQDELLEKLGLEKENVEELTSKYGSLSEAIREATVSKLKDAQIDLLKGLKMSENDMINAGKGYEKFYDVIDRNIINATGDDSVKAFQVLENAGIVESGSYGSAGGSFVLTGDENVEGTIANYERLQSALRALQAEFSATDLKDNDLFLALKARADELEESVESYISSVEAVNKGAAQIVTLEAMDSIEIPNTEDTFKKFREELIATAIESEQFIGTEVEIENAINAYLSTLPEFVGYYSGAVQTEVEKTTSAIEQENTKLFDILLNSKEALNSFQESVQSAYKSFENLTNQNISPTDMLSSIQSINEAVSSMGGSLNWEFIDKHENSLEILGGAIDHITEKYAKSVLSGAGIDVNSRFGQMLANCIVQAQKASEQLSNLNTNIDSLQSAYSDLTDIVKSYNETGYLTFDQLQTLLELEPQYLQCLIDENGQLQLNEQAMVTLANQRLNDAEAQAVQQAITELGQLALHDEKVAIEENAQAFTDAVDDLAGYNKELANTIAEATVGATCIRDLNSAIKGAESEGATDDQINTVLSNLETKLQAINSVRDKLNTDGIGDVLKESNTNSSKDKWLEEYKQKLSLLQDELDKQIISERQFYIESEKLLNTYLKNNPQNIKKYSQEISNAEKALHDNWINAFEAEKVELEALYNDGSIPQKAYLARLKQIIDAYYVSGEAVGKYGQFTKEAAEEQRAFNDLYDDFVNNAFDGIALMLDKVISKYEDQRDAAEKTYEAQEKAIDAQIEQLDEQIDAINKQIDAVDKVIEAKQKEIDKIQETSDEINKQIQYQKNLMALEEAQNNKSVATLKGGKVSYDIDYSALKDAKEAVRQDEEQKRIDAIEKEIKALESEKEVLEQTIDVFREQQEALEKQQQAIQKMSEESSEHFEKLIDAVTKYQSRWQDLQSVAEDSKIIDGMKGLLDEWGISTEQVMNMSDSAFEQFKVRYMNHLDAMSAKNMSLKDSINDTFMLNDIAGFEDFITRAVDSMGLMGEIDLSSTTDGLAGVSEGLGVVEESAHTATASISTAGLEDEESPASLTGAIGTAYTTASETLPVVSGMLDGVASSANNAANAVNNLANAMSNLNSGSVSVPSVGTAPGFASGSPSIPEDMNAFTQEKGPEIIVSPSRKAIYTPLKEGDSVFTAEMTKNLWEWSKLKPNLAMVNMGMPSTAITSDNISNYNNTNAVNNFEFNVSMPNVTDSSQAQALVNELHSLATAKYRYFNKRR